MLIFGLFFGGCILFIILASFAHTHILFPHLRSMSTTVKKVSTPTSVLRIPRTAHEAHALLSDYQFELFSAAVIIGLGQGYAFVMHVGGSGDGGVDTILQNAMLKRVYVQSKQYLYGDVQVNPHDVRDFIGTLSMSRAIYGYLVTTSTLTPQACREANNGNVRIIDASQLDYLLQQRQREIALAYQDVLNAVRQQDYTR